MDLEKRNKLDKLLVAFRFSLGWTESLRYSDEKAKVFLEKEIEEFNELIEPKDWSKE